MSDALAFSVHHPIRILRFLRYSLLGIDLILFLPRECYFSIQWQFSMILPGGNRMLLRITSLIALAAALVLAAPKDRDWQTGTLLDTADNIYFGRVYSR